MSNYWNKAFTIIESLVIIGIVGVVTVVTIASYTTFTESSKLKTEVQRFISVLSLAQKRAVTGEDVSNYCSNCSFHSVVVTYTESGGYTMQGQSAPDAAPTPTPYPTSTSYTIDTINKNITILDSGTVTFTKLTGTPDAPKSIRFKNVAKNECITVDISASGLISSNAPYTC